MFKYIFLILLTYGLYKNIGWIAIPIVAVGALLLYLFFTYVLLPILGPICSVILFVVGAAWTLAVAAFLIWFYLHIIASTIYESFTETWLFAEIIGFVVYWPIALLVFCSLCGGIVGGAGESLSHLAVYARRKTGYDDYKVDRSCYSCAHYNRFSCPYHDAKTEEDFNMVCTNYEKNY